MSNRSQRRAAAAYRRSVAGQIAEKQERRAKLVQELEESRGDAETWCPVGMDVVRLNELAMLDEVLQAAYRKRDKNARRR